MKRIRKDERVARELRGEYHPNELASGPQSGAEYVTTIEAVALLRCSIDTILHSQLPRLKSGRRRRDSARGRRPFLFERVHIARALTLRRNARVSATNALRIVFAEINGLV